MCTCADVVHRAAHDRGGADLRRRRLARRVDRERLRARQATPDREVSVE